MGRKARSALAALVAVLCLGVAAHGAPVPVSVDVTQPVRPVNPLIYGSQIEAKMESDQDIRDFVDWAGLEFIRLWGGSTGDFLWDEPRDAVQSRYPCLGIPPDGDLNQSVWGDTDDTFEWFDSIGMPGHQLMVTVPAASTSPERVANWVDYVNNVRGEGVVYWVIGCEPWGDWDCAHQTPEEYSALVNAYGAAMKAVDSDIRIVASVGGAYYDSSSNWDRVVVNLAGDTIDGLCYHWYPGMQMDYSDPEAAALWVTGNVLAFKPKVMDRYRQIIAEEAPDRVGEIEIGVGEVDGAANAPTSDLPPYEQNIVSWGVGDMLFWAGYLGEAQAQGVAFSAQYSLQECPFGLIRGWSVWGGWGGRPWDGVTIRAKAYAMKLYSEHFRGTVVETTVTGSDTFYKPLQWREETYEGDVPHVASYSTLDSDGKLCVMVINRHPSESRMVSLTINGYDVGTTATLYDVGGTASSIVAQNDYDYGEPSGQVNITETIVPASNPFIHDFPAHSCTAVIFRGTSEPTAPAAAFMGTPTSGAPPLTVSFADLSAGTPTSWVWDFGDGSTSTVQHPTHEYARLGAFDVSLTAANDLGVDTETKANYIAVTFPDVPLGHWAFDAVCACYNAGIVAGYDNGTYRPSASVTRDQMAVYISRALELVTQPYEGRFPDDVPDTQWAWPWIEALARAGIVQGFDATHYRPDDIVNRDAMAVYVARSMWGGIDVPSGPAEGTFEDVPDYDPGPAHWAYDEIEYCVANEVVKGYDPTHYRPDEPVTRDQMAVYVAKAFALPM